jgi:hypothetical protein
VFGVDPIEARKSGDDTYISTLLNELERDILLPNVSTVPILIKSRNSESSGDDNASGPIGFIWISPVSISTSSKYTFWCGNMADLSIIMIIPMRPIAKDNDGIRVKLSYEAVQITPSKAWVNIGRTVEQLANKKVDLDKKIAADSSVRTLGVIRMMKFSCKTTSTHPRAAASCHV